MLVYTVSEKTWGFLQNSSEILASRFPCSLNIFRRRGSRTTSAENSEATQNSCDQEDNSKDCVTRLKKHTLRKRPQQQVHGGKEHMFSPRIEGNFLMHSGTPAFACCLLARFGKFASLSQRKNLRARSSTL